MKLNISMARTMAGGTYLSEVNKRKIFNLRQFEQHLRIHKYETRHASQNTQKSEEGIYLYKLPCKVLFES